MACTDTNSSPIDIMGSIKGKWRNYDNDLSFTANESGVIRESKGWILENNVNDNPAYGPFRLHNIGSEQLSQSGLYLIQKAIPGSEDRLHYSIEYRTHAHSLDFPDRLKQ